MAHRLKQQIIFIKVIQANPPHTLMKGLLKAREYIHHTIKLVNRGISTNTNIGEMVNGDIDIKIFLITSTSLA